MTTKALKATLPKELTMKPIQKLTYEDYEQLTPPDNGNYELHNGKIVFIATPTPRHQDIVGNLFIAISLHIRQHQLGKAYIAPMDTQFDPYTVLQPDLLFIKKDSSAAHASSKRIEGVPDLVVEVLSPSTAKNDLSFKKYIYEAYGVTEYWVVDLENETIIQYHNFQNVYDLVGRWKHGDTLKSTAITGLEIPISSIFE